MTFFEDNGWIVMLLMIGGIAYWVIKNIKEQLKDYEKDE